LLSIYIYISYKKNKRVKLNMSDEFFNVNQGCNFNHQHVKLSFA